VQENMALKRQIGCGGRRLWGGSRLKRHIRRLRWWRWCHVGGAVGMGCGGGATWDAG
jgi:hypothetical protein